MERNSSDDHPSATPKQRRAPSGAAAMQPGVTHALTRAFFTEWAERGYGALSLEAVARRAGVGKAALYRRWPSKPDMAVDLLERIGIALAASPDTGSLEGDLESLILSIRRILRHPLARRIVPDLHAEMARAPKLAAGIQGRLQSERRARVRTIVERAIGRGEIGSGADTELAADAVGGLIYWRVIVTGGRADTAAVATMARFIAAGLRG